MRPPRSVGLLLAAAVWLALGADASAQAAPRGRVLADLGAVHTACRRAEREGPRRLYSMEVAPAGYAFATYDDEEGKLWVDSRRNLVALEGAVQLLPTGLESIGFTTSEERASLLRAARARGAKLRIGFFLGFDGRSGTLCLLRPAAGVTTARIDVAYVELLDSDGSVLAREDTERLRAYLDDPERRPIPGRGPRGLVGEPTLLRGARAVPPSLRASLVSPSPAVLEAFGRCHGAAVRRGATRDAQVVVRLVVDGASGRVAASEVELTTLGDAEGATCVAEALARAVVPEPQGGPGTIELRVPVRLVAD